VNPNTGREYQYDKPQPAKEPKKIFVVGSGPSGFQVARLASQRGHDVTLFDEKRRAGGSTLLAGIIDERIGMHSEYIQTQLKKMPIKHMRLGQKAIATTIDSEKPDVVVIASGGVPPAYDIPGVEGSNVTSGSDIQKMLGGDSVKKGLMWRLASFYMKYMYRPGLVRTLAKGPFPFKKRVIIGGGGFAGCELGEFLLRKGKEVTIIEENTRLASDMGPIYRWVLLTRLRTGKARLETGAKVEEITGGGVKVKKENETIFIEGDTVVLAKALQPDEKLISALSDNGVKVFAVGDGAKPAKIMEANASGFTLGHEI
jgi:2,4-dienoyl-CoA reductase (NADPH2)